MGSPIAASDDDLAWSSHCSQNIYLDKCIHLFYMSYFLLSSIIFLLFKPQHTQVTLVQCLHIIYYLTRLESLC